MQKNAQEKSARRVGRSTANYQVQKNATRLNVAEFTLKFKLCYNHHIFLITHKLISTRHTLSTNCDRTNMKVLRHFALDGLGVIKC